MHPEVPDFETLITGLNKVIWGAEEAEWDEETEDVIDNQDTEELINIGIHVLQRSIRVSDTSMDLEIQEQLNRILGQWVTYRLLIRGLDPGAPTEPVDPTPSPGPAPPSPGPRTPSPATRLPPNVPQLDALTKALNKFIWGAPEVDWDKETEDVIDSQHTTELINNGIDALHRYADMPGVSTNPEILEQVNRMLDEWVRYRTIISGLNRRAPTQPVGAGMSAVDPTPSPHTPDDDPSNSDIPDATQRMLGLGVSSLFHSAGMSFILILS